MQGRRLPDTKMNEFPKDVQPGDYWKILNSDGTPRIVHHPGKLTETCWFACPPRPDGDGFALGRLEYHTVREHEDGTISVLPNDGSSNSIAIQGAHGYFWHGYIYNGVWKEI